MYNVRARVRFRDFEILAREAERCRLGCAFRHIVAFARFKEDEEDRARPTDRPSSVRSLLYRRCQNSPPTERSRRTGPLFFFLPFISVPFLDACRCLSSQHASLISHDSEEISLSIYNNIYVSLLYY